ncbi:epoxide hydrolase 1 [Trichonephila clavipes]|nr:epoxide hydrolase 1 [Trichonephila clavipes]
MKLRLFSVKVCDFWVKFFLQFKMVLGLSVVAIIIYNIVKFLYRLFFGKVEKDLSGYEEGWYGKGSKPKEGAEDTSIHPFKISIPDEILLDLKERLQRARYEPSLEDSKFEYGFNSDYLKSVIEYWGKEYNWRKQEEQLNKFSHFKTRIEGIDVHFVHVKPNIPEGRQPGAQQQNGIRNARQQNMKIPETVRVTLSSVSK